MEIRETKIKGLIVLQPRIFEDDRGLFFESFNHLKFEEFIGRKITFVQDNESVSKKGVVRGLHFQEPPFSQGKLVHVSHGSVIDVAVDLRKNSPTYGQWHSELLSAQNHTLFWIPEGFAHGFVALEENTTFLYKCTNYYQPNSERTILWNDGNLSIDWGPNSPIVSSKDLNGEKFANFVTPY